MGYASTLNQLTFDELTDRLASRDPVPGGGSAAALAGSLAASLLSMVAELTPDDAVTAEIGTAAREMASRLSHLAQADADAYGGVVAARRLPKETEDQRRSRSAARRAAMADAASTPLRTAQAAFRTLELADRLAPIASASAVSDVGVAGQLAGAALRGALLNVRINLPYLAPDEPLRASLPEEARLLEKRAGPIEDRVTGVVASRMEAA